jgi:magnesium transporter
MLAPVSQSARPAKPGRPTPSEPPPPSRRADLRALAPEASAASPGTLLVRSTERPRIFLLDYCAERVVVEREIASLDEIVPFLTDDLPSVTWVDVRGIGHTPTFERLGEIFRIHPLALEDVVNVPQRPKTDAYPDQQVVVARMVRHGGAGALETEQIGIVFGKGFVLTVQEVADTDALAPVRERIHRGRGILRSSGSDYLAYAIIDAIVDGFYPVLEALGERLEDMELGVMMPSRATSHEIHDVKRDLLTVRRAIWPQRDLVNGLLRDESPHVHKETRVYLRDTYDHAVQVMDMVETFREIASGLMDLYLSSISNRMNEIMKVLTILSTIFLPNTFIAGVYGMNFETGASGWNMPELKWRWGYPFALGLMAASVVSLLVYYRRKGWLGAASAERRARRESESDAGR